jgi:hypothetical protein
MRLRENLEQALQNPERDIHLALQLQRLFEIVEQEEAVPNQIEEVLDEIEELPFDILFSQLEGWHSDNDFSEATDALDQLSELIDDAYERDWHSVATTLYHKRIKLKAGLSGHSPQAEIQAAHSHLLDHHEDIHSNVMQSAFKIVDENTDTLSESDIHDWASLSDDIAVSHGEANQFIEQRRYLSYVIKFREGVGGDIESARERLIDSYDREAELKGQRSSHFRADILERGLDRCIEFLDEEKQEEWKRQSVEARLDAAENEMAEVSPDKELLEAVAEESRKNTERLMKWFETRAEMHDSSKYALYCLLCSDGYLPSYEQALNAEHGLALPQMLETQVTSPEGHAIATNPSLRELGDEQIRVPTGYVQNLMTMNRTLAGALHRLIDRGSLTEFDFYTLLEIAPLSVDTRSFLVEGVIDLFEGNPAQSFALSIPHLESAIVDTLDEQNRSATAFTGDGTQQQTLGGMFNNLQSDIEDEYWAYLKVKYTDPRGPNLRNRWSHGQLRYFQANFQNAAILLVDVLKTTIQLNPTTYIAVFGFPFRTISTERRRREGIDISRYVETGEEVRAYGYAEDVGVVVVEDEEEDQTSFIVVRGGVRQDYGHDESSLPRSEIAEYIEMLQSPAPNLPEDIELTWVESDEEIQEHTLEIVESITNQTQQSASPSKVIKAAEQCGIDSEQAETAIESLKSEGVVIESDGGLTLADPEHVG